MTLLTFTDANGEAVSFLPERAIVAGWSGRDAEAIRHHIEELGALGVAAPSQVPLYYRVSAALFTNSTAIEVVGAHSSGEIEPILFHDGSNLWLGLGSDHTDRALEAHSVALSKQACAKPVATRCWNFGEVEAHAEEIEFRSWIRDRLDEDWTPYQQGSLANLRPLHELISGAGAVHGRNVFAAGTIMMGGTFGVMEGGIRPARYFRMSMHDPVLGRTIEHSYETISLPMVS